MLASSIEPALHVGSAAAVALRNGHAAEIQPHHKFKVNVESRVIFTGVNATGMARRIIVKIGAEVNMALARIDNWGALTSEGGLTLVNDHRAAGCINRFTDATSISFVSQAPHGYSFRWNSALKCSSPDFRLSRVRR